MIASRGARNTRVWTAFRSPRAKIVTLSWGAYVSSPGALSEPGMTVSIA